MKKRMWNRDLPEKRKFSSNRKDERKFFRRRPLLDHIAPAEGVRRKLAPARTTERRQALEIYTDTVDRLETLDRIAHEAGCPTTIRLDNVLYWDARRKFSQQIPSSGMPDVRNF